MTDAAPAVAPVRESVRITALDVLRGFAILGILMVNVQWFALATPDAHRPAGEVGSNPLRWRRNPPGIAVKGRAYA